MKQWYPILFLLCLNLPVMSGAEAASPINTLDKKGLLGYKETDTAIRGFDTVAYFTLGKAVKGKRKYQHQWRGANWLFSSEHHRTLFSNDPERYAPQFGGYCAYGVADGYLVKIEGKQWSIVDDKLYLSYNRKFRLLWEDNPQHFIDAANKQFKALI